MNPNTLVLVFEALYWAHSLLPGVKHCSQVRKSPSSFLQLSNSNSHEAPQPPKPETLHGPKPITPKNIRRRLTSGGNPRKVGFCRVQETTLN